MNCQVMLVRLCAVCGVLAACAASAADVNRCRDTDGLVLLTDQPCPQQSAAVDEAATEPAGAAVTATRDEQLPAVEPKRSPWADLPHALPHRAIGLDASTLQAARSAVMMQDELRRQRKLASVH